MARGAATASLPQWIKPQLAKLADRAPNGAGWLHEIKLDGYRMHARFAGSRARLLTRTGLDWTARYTAIAAELAGLPGSAYLDGEICAVRPDGVTSFALLQAANAAGDGLVFFAFDLLYLGAEPLHGLPLRERKTQLAALIGAGVGWLRYVDPNIPASRKWSFRPIAADRPP
jgi:ATP-dependent DNA ligase